jgi:hypothetical protein
MKAMEYCDGCRFAHLAVDCYGREDGLYCGVFCMPLGKMHFILDEPCDDRSQRTKEKKETTK